jgi:hypothetical protein
MKNSIICLIAAVALFSTSCREKQTATFVGEMKVYLNNEHVSTGKRGVAMQFYLETDAELCTMWPGGNRQIRQTSSGRDSLDVWGNYVLARSDDYRDYGLNNAAGVRMTVTESERIGSGFECTYTFSRAGTYEIYFLATKHGYDSPDWQRTIKTFTFTVTD